MPTAPLIARGIGFMPGSVRYLPTLGLTPTVAADLTVLEAPMEEADYTFAHLLMFMPAADFIQRLANLGHISSTSVADSRKSRIRWNCRNCVRRGSSSFWLGRVKETRSPTTRRRTPTVPLTASWRTCSRSWKPILRRTGPHG
jgi:hypothetical protein